jgi:hypothetical protein
MKKFLLIQFIFSFLIILVLEVSAAAYKNNLTVSSISPVGIASQVVNFNLIFSLTHLNDSGLLPSSMSDEQAALDLDETIASMLASSDPLVVAEGQHLQSLAYDIHSTIFIRSGNLTYPEGNTAECVDSDASSIGTLYEDNPQFNQVELITIRIEQESDLATVMNLDSLQTFTNLKYINFLCTFQICSSPGCEPTMISQMVQGTNPDIMILYKISVPE